MIITLDEKTDNRLKTWSKFNKQPPEIFINEAIERSLEDWEDYLEALEICAEIDSGKIKTYSLEEVERHLDELNSMEN